MAVCRTTISHNDHTTDTTRCYHNVNKYVHITIVTRPDVCFQVFQLAEFGVSSVSHKGRQVIGRFQLGRTRHINFVVNRCIQTQLGFCTLFLQFPYAIKNHRRTIKIPLAFSAIRVEYVYRVKSILYLTFKANNYI